MTLTYFNDINVYFHMKNHYKMLKNVKSVIDTSIPQSLLKSPLSMNSLEKRMKGATNEHLRKIYNSPIYMPKRGGQIKKHNCLNSEAKSEGSLRAYSLPSRPSTRRNPISTPKENLPIRSCSVGPPTDQMFKFKQKKRSSVSSTRSSNAESQNTQLQLDLQKENVKSPCESLPSSKKSQVEKNDKTEGPEKSPKSDQHFLKESSEEHEYLLFLLRITEDIIVNDFYSNNDIKQVFRFHIQANKGRLNTRKMRHHIANLCTELNIDCEEYQTAENNESDSPEKFTNSPKFGSYYLNNEAFLNCHDCATIRTSSLHNMPSLFGDILTEGESIRVSSEDNAAHISSISPSLLKLLDKLSLGRVTECTEPAASTSTMLSPKYLASNNLGRDASRIYDSVEKSPVDFDTFVKELNSKEHKSQGDNNTNTNLNPDKDIISLESPPLEMYTALIKDIPSDNRDLLETSNALNPKSLSHELLAVPNVSNEESKSEVEISEKDIKSLTISENYESEFEKCSSSNSILKTDGKSDVSDEERPNNFEKKPINEPKTNANNVTNQEPNDMSNVYLKETEEVVNSNCLNVALVKENQLQVQTSLNKISTLSASSVKIVDFEGNLAIESLLDSKIGDNITTTKNLSILLDPIEEIQFKGKDIKAANNTDLNEESLVGKVSSAIIQTANELNNRDIVLPPSVQNTDEASPKISEHRLSSAILQTANELHTGDIVLPPSVQNTDKASPEISVHRTDSNKLSHSFENLDNEKQDATIKIIFQGALNDDDYVMIKGPVYIYKPLLDSDPKLVVFDNDNNQKSRRKSVDSQHSNRTFTVENSQLPHVEHDNADEAIQYNTSLHSLEVDNSMENILELTRRAYSQSVDAKLLLSDYDLTPQKDSTDNKYHYLLMDATTSISGVNIKESLLLSDDYLVKHDQNTEIFAEHTIMDVPKETLDHKTVDNIDNYIKFEPKFYDQNYVIHRKRKLMSSVSMPKLQLSGGKATSEGPREKINDALKSRRATMTNEFRNSELLTKHSSDFINFDLPSQDSSLRSEGETFQHLDKLKSGGVPWSSYFN